MARRPAKNAVWASSKRCSVWVQAPEVGRQVGPRILRLRILDKRRERLNSAQDFLAGRGGSAVLLGRWVGFTLQLLARNRMVEIHPNKGVLIPPASVEAQLRLLELRRVLEVLAVRLPCQRASETIRARMADMLAVLAGDAFTLEAYAETVKDTHDLVVAGANNDYLADAMAPLQGLSRRFWFTHVVDPQAEITTGSKLHSQILQAILDRDPQAAEGASLALNDYLVDFAYTALQVSH